MKDKRWFIAVVDCTGHGVPGGFMSMIGQRLLSEIVIESRVEETEEVLTRLDNGVKKALKQNESENMDGMDVVLCRLDLLPNGGYEIQFTGAKRPLFVFDRNKREITQIKGDKKPVGGRHYNKTVFTHNILQLAKGDMIYLSTDGLIDQNSPDRKRFGTPKFVEVLNEIADKPLDEQFEIIDDIANNFRDTEEQRDDITVWGVQL